MGSIGPAEILVVLVVALLVLGPSRLPDAARSLGRAIGEVRRYTSGFQTELRDAFSDPQPPSYPASPSDTAPMDWSSSVEEEPPAAHQDTQSPSAEAEAGPRAEGDGSSAPASA